MTEPLEGTMTEPQTSESSSTKLEPIAKLAKKAPEMVFRSLAYCSNMEFLREAYRRTRKAGAAGVDEQSADDALLLFENEEDRRVMAVLPKRFGTYDLTLPPEKTRLVEFRRPDCARRPRPSLAPSICSASRTSGALRAPASGSSSAKQPRTASEERLSVSLIGAVCTFTIRSRVTVRPRAP
jgi:hypothetical protein